MDEWGFLKKKVSSPYLLNLFLYAMAPHFSGKRAHAAWITLYLFSVEVSYCGG